MITGFLIYAAIFYLSVISVGTISIILGYKLLILGIVPTTGTDIEAQTKEIKLTVRNATPGTSFALFGAVIVAFVLMKGTPALIAEQYLENNQNINQNKGKVKSSSKIMLKGGEQSATNIQKLDSKIAEIFNDLAWSYQQQGRMEEALSFVTLATEIDSNNANYIDTLATIHLKLKNFEEALKQASRAVDLSPTADYLKTLALALEENGKKTEALGVLRKIIELDPSYEPRLKEIRQRLEKYN